MRGKVVSTRILFLVCALGLFILGLLVVFRFNFPHPSNTNGSSPSGEHLISEAAPEENAIAPDFTLLNTEGEEITLSQLRGQPMLINFWATWCAPCRLEMPAMQNRFEEYAKDGLQILAVNFDEPLEVVHSFADEFNLTFNLLLDPGGEIQRAYRIRGYPTSFFVDSDGIIRVVHIGVMSEGQLDDYLAEIGVGG